MTPTPSTQSMKEAEEVFNSSPFSKKGIIIHLAKALDLRDKKAREETEASLITQIEDGTRKVFGDGTKGPWKMLLDAARQEERERCAKVAEDLKVALFPAHKDYDGRFRGANDMCGRIAAAIRRG